MEMLQLRYFYDSAQNENFTKTAEKYMVPASSVSASVRLLEKELGCPLFDRMHNRIILNNNGKRLQQALCSAFAELDSAVSKISNTPTDNREIHILVRAMRSDVTDYIIEYNKKHPDIIFKTIFDSSEDDTESYDIIIDEKNDAYPQYEGFELFNMRIRMKVSSKSPLARRKVVLKQLCNQPFVSLSTRSNMHKMLIKACKAAGFTPNVVAEINDILCHEKMIASGIGIGLGREHHHSANSAGDIVFLDVTDFDERYIVYTYYKKQSAYGNVEHFLEFMKSKANK